MIMRFADADVLPYDFNDFADTIHKYSGELKKLLKDRQEEIHDRNQALDDGAFSAVSDPRHPTFAPKRDEVPPFLNFAPLDNAESALSHSAERYAKAMKTFLAKGASASPQTLQNLNTRLMQAEQRLTNADGLPRRPWYRHLIYAPGFYTGYGAKTLPGVREGIEEKRYKEAEAEIVRAAKALQDYAAVIDGVAGEMEK
jgi:N-acetylated-alpha-linked acidic dipeptidase